MIGLESYMKSNAKSGFKFIMITFMFQKLLNNGLTHFFLFLSTLLHYTLEKLRQSGIAM